MNDVEKMLQDFMQHARAGGEFIIFDFETTGFSATKDCALSFSAIKATFNVDTGKFVEINRMDQYINPERRIPADVTKLTGIDYNRIKNEPTEEEAAFKIAPFLGSSPYIIGQNIGFDIRFMTAMSQRCGFPFNPIGVTDTLTLAKKMIGPRSENHKLGTLVDFFNISKEGLMLHESISDVILTGKVLEHFIMMYQDKLDVDKVATDYKKRKEAETEFTPVAEEDTPFFKTEEKEPIDTYLIRPKVVGISYWTKFSNRRVYVNMEGTNLKAYFNLVTGEWESKFDWNSPERLDMDYIKTESAKFVRLPENKWIYDKIMEAKEERKRGTR